VNGDARSGLLCNACCGLECVAFMCCPLLILAQGGESTPLIQSGGSFASVTPKHITAVTPNHVIGTPRAGGGEHGPLSLSLSVCLSVCLSVSLFLSLSVFVLFAIHLLDPGDKSHFFPCVYGHQPLSHPSSTHADAWPRRHGRCGLAGARRAWLELGEGQHADDDPAQHPAPEPGLSRLALSLCVSVVLLPSFLKTFRSFSFLFPLTNSMQALRQELRAGLAMLPEPKRDYDVVVPDLPEDDMETGEERVVDAAEIDEQRLARERAEEERRLALRSQPFQRKLPIPTAPNKAILRVDAAETAEQEADEVVKREMLAVLEFDRSGVPLQDEFTAEELAQAKV
jgi:hypothetical protein